MPRKRRKTTLDVDNRNREEHSPSSQASSVSAPLYSTLELERGIQLYQSLLSQYFPFIILSDTLHDSRKFAEEKPFLSLVIAMLGCTQDRSRQRTLVWESRKYLSTHVLLDGEASLDLLQGLLLKIHWSVLPSNSRSFN